MNGLIRFHRSPLGAAPLNVFARGNNGASSGTSIDELFDTVASQLFGDIAPASESTVLRADVRETTNAYVISLDVPGASKEDITVDVDEKSVRIEVKRAGKTEAVEGEKVHVSERAVGVGSRSFRLSQPVDADGASAVHEHGVLTLTLPKKNASAQKRLTIN